MMPTKLLDMCSCNPRFMILPSCVILCYCSVVLCFCFVQQKELNFKLQKVRVKMGKTVKDASLSCITKIPGPYYKSNLWVITCKIRKFFNHWWITGWAGRGALGGFLLKKFWNLDALKSHFQCSERTILS